MYLSMFKKAAGVFANFEKKNRVPLRTAVPVCAELSYGGHTASKGKKEINKLDYLLRATLNRGQCSLKIKSKPSLLITG